MPDIRELGRKVKAKYPGAYNDLDDADLGRRVKAKYPGAYDDFTDTPAAQPAPATAPGGRKFDLSGLPVSVIEAIDVGLQRAGANLGEAALAVSDLVQGFRRGDVRPAAEMGERAIRSVASTMGDLMGRGEMAKELARPEGLAEAQQRSEARRLTESPYAQGFQGVRELQRQADIRAARDPSLTGKIIRRGTEFAASAGPAVATGIATGGSVPAMATLAILQSAGQPETLPLNVALEVAPIPLGQAFRAGVGAVRRALGKGAAQVIEAEAAPAAVAQVRREIGAPPPLTAEAPPAAGAAIPSPPIPSANPLESAFAKLGTDNTEQIGAMIANANRRFKKKNFTPEQRASAVADYKALSQLTPDEQRALGQVLPMRNVAPVLETGKSRDIQNIPMSEFELDPQLAANLRQGMAYFDEQGRLLQQAEDAAILGENAPIMGDIGPGATSGQFGAQPARVSAADLVTTPLPPRPGRVVTVGDETYILTPEQEARWVAEIDSQAVRNKGDAMRLAAIKRDIVKAPTPKEEAAAIAREKTNYVGKPVLVNVGGQQVPATVEGMAFGRVRVRLADGQKVAVERGAITDPAAATAPRIEAETGLPAPSTAAPTPIPSAIGDRVRTMARTPTSPVSVAEVRRQFPGVGKKEFDDEMVRLVEEGQIALHRNDAPGQLTAAERDAMVKIGDNYYTAATVRGPRAEAAAFEVAPPAAAPPSPPLPPGEIPTGFGGQPPGPQTHLFDYAPSLSRLTNVWQRTKDELFGALGAPKSLKSSYDISYPFRQGALLLLRPLQWRQAAKVWGNAFKGFRTKNFEEIKRAIELHPLAKRMEDAGLYRGMISGEEAFPKRGGSKITEVVEKTPGIKHSQQAFTASADTQRVQAFEQYARAIDRAGLSTAEALKADKAAAQWINITTGRGSLGQRIDKAFDALNLAFFSPRYIASRLNILNPVMYARNLSSPGGRVVLRQQMADLAQFTGVVATTLYLAKQAGADVGLNPESPDFLKIRFGNHRYDMLAGLQQVMRAGYRISSDIARAARGEKPKFGETAIDIGETFLSYKLAPPASVFRSFINQQTPGGKDFTAARAAADLVAPIQWADFVDAWRDESFGAALKTLPGVPGIGTQHYQLDPVEAALDRTRPLLAEVQRLKIRVAELQRGKDKQGKPEPDDAFNARVQQFSQNYTSYGLRLIQDPRFQIASDEVKTKALKRLNEKAKGLTHREFAFPEIELDPGLILDSVQQ